MLSTFQGFCNATSMNYALASVYKVEILGQTTSIECRLVT